MKNIYLKTVLCFAALYMAGSCSTENDSLMLEESEISAAEVNAVLQSARGSYWDGVIATDEGNGVYLFIADTIGLKKDLEGQLSADGINTKLQTLYIVQKTAANDATDQAHMLIGSDNYGVSIGVMLVSNGRELALTRDTSIQKSVSCTGCPTGCNLEYLLVNGHKYPYCNENGCGVDCVKSERSL